MNRTHAAALWLPLPCLTLLAAGCVARTDTGDYDKSYPIAGRATVNVRTNDGNVRVVTSDAKDVTFHVKYEGVGRGRRIDSRQEGDSVTLEAEMGSAFFFGGHQRMEIEVRMPKDADLRVESKDGGIRVDAVNGHVVIHTDDGSIRASQLSGTVDLSSSDGSIRVDAVKGDLKIRTDDGSIGGEHLDGKCEASTSDGSIRVDGRFDALHVRSDDGSVVARVESGSVLTSSWQLRTSDGSVHLTLPPDLKANLDASSNNGSVTLEPPVKVDGHVSHSRIQGAMNGGGPEVLVHTSSGSIHVGST
jgi:DUF4097 and DUF4098 domain-containing protein YvlB